MTATAPARAALAGNPSDGYGGAVLAVAVGEQRAEAAIRPGAAGSWSEPPCELVDATVSRFARKLEPAAAGAAVEWRTSIPRGVGLGGSSAIVIATLRALCEAYGVALEPPELAAFALAVEVEDLGIAAGLQDRVAQAYGGLTFMDFGERARYERLDARPLPPLVLAWRVEAADDSGAVHQDLRLRFDRGESVVRSGMARLRTLACTARDALRSGDVGQLGRCVDGSFDARREMLALDPLHVEMIEIARDCGASANYTGSGGAIVAVCRDEPHRRAAAEALAGGTCEVLSPGLHVG